MATQVQIQRYGKRLKTRGMAAGILEATGGVGLYSIIAFLCTYAYTLLAEFVEIQGQIQVQIDNTEYITQALDTTTYVPLYR